MYFYDLNLLKISKFQHNITRYAQNRQNVCFWKCRFYLKYALNALRCYRFTFVLIYELVNLQTFSNTYLFIEDVLLLSLPKFNDSNQMFSCLMK